MVTPEITTVEEYETGSRKYTIAMVQYENGAVYFSIYCGGAIIETHLNTLVKARAAADKDAKAFAS